MHVNQVVLAGNLTADPVLRNLPSGDPVVRFGIAVNRPKRMKDGTFDSVLEGYFDCEAWDDLAVSVARTLRKGSPVQLFGSLLMKEYLGNDGNAVKKIEIRVRNIGLVIGREKKSEAEAPAAQAAPEPVPA